MSVWKLSNVSCLSKFTVYEFEHDIENKTYLNPCSDCIFIAFRNPTTIGCGSFY